MKDIKQYILESQNIQIDRDTIAEECPNFWKAVSQFCRDKNTEVGVDFLIASWTWDLNDFKKAYPNEKDWPFNDNELREFEEKYLNDEAYEEVEKYQA